MLGFTLPTDSKMCELCNYFLKLYNTNYNQGFELCNGNTSSNNGCLGTCLLFEIPEQKARLY